MINLCIYFLASGENIFYQLRCEYLFLFDFFRIKKHLAIELPDWKNNSDQTHSCPRGWCLSVIMRVPTEDTP